MFEKGEHERQIAYEAHTACDKNGIVLAVEVTAGNVNDSVADAVDHEEDTGRQPDSHSSVYAKQDNERTFPAVGL